MNAMNAVFVLRDKKAFFLFVDNSQWGREGAPPAASSNHALTKRGVIFTYYGIAVLYVRQHGVVN